jgi:TolB-like protein
MAQGRPQRRLAAILSADVVGYSRLMSIDEAATLSRLNALRRELIDPAIAAHSGRIVKLIGDGTLVEFASAVEAVTCAIDVQRQLGERQAATSETDPMRFRIGVHVGDIIIEGEDIFGDGVNIAARIEGAAEPGGIAISEDAWRQVQGKVAVDFVDAGEQDLKNIPRPVRVYRVQVADERAGKSPASPLQSPETPSIAVLPFQNMSGDPEQEYFADGMVEDIITALSRFKSLFVIARNSSFTYKGKSIDIKQVGRDLGVRYVLEGSVRKSGSRVRITGQLIEAASGRHLWADKFDGALQDVFDLQDQVTSSVIGLIAPTLEHAEIERARQKPTENLNSYVFFVRGLALLNKSALAEAREFFAKAYEQEPEYGPAYAMAATALMFEQAASGVPLTAARRAEAIRLANLASRVASDDAFTLARAGHVLTYLGGEYDRGVSMVEQAVALNPNLAIAWYSCGWVTMMCGEAERSIESFDRMIRLSPLDPLRVQAWNGTSLAFLILGRYEDGCASATKSIQVVANAHTLVAYILNAMAAGWTAQARQAAERLRRLKPDFRATHAEEAFPVRSPEMRGRMIAALREAGLPG